MVELGYKAGADKRKIRQKYVLHGKRYYSADKYYGAVYEDIVKYKEIDATKIKSDQDLRRFLEGDTKITQKLINKLQKSSYHQALININLGKEAYRLKNGKIVRTESTIKRGQEVRYYKDMLVIARKQRTFYRDVRTGKFISLK